MRAGLPRLHLVTDDRILEEGFLPRALEALDTGGPEIALHMRGPATSVRRLHDLARALLAPARAAGSLLLAHDRADLALVLGLDGVSLPERGLPPGVARALLGPDLWIGASVHSDAGAREAAEGGVDFLVAGTVFATPSHPGRPGAGVERVEAVARAAGTSAVVAIGGVTPARVASVLRAGAHGVAVLRGVWAEPSVSGAVRAYLEALGRGAEGGSGPTTGGGTS